MELGVKAMLHVVLCPCDVTKVHGNTGASNMAARYTGQSVMTVILRWIDEGACLSCTL